MNERFIKLHLSTLQHEDLTLLEKVILEEIRALHQLNNCHISNGTLGQMLNVSKCWIGKSIKNLEKKGYIRIEYPSKTRRVIIPTIAENTIVENAIAENTIVESATNYSRKCYSTIAESATNYSRKCYLLDKDKINRLEEVEDEDAGGDFAKAMNLYMDNINNEPKQLEAEMVGDLFDTYGFEWLYHAIRETVRCQGGGIGYIESILKRWKETGSDQPWLIPKKQPEKDDDRPEYLN